LKPTLLILAAGMGSRYGGIKQIEPVGPNGEIIIDYSIYDAIQAGFKKLVFVIRKEIENAFREKFNHLENRIEIAYVFQETKLSPDYPKSVGRDKPWGTGHAILSAADELNDPFVVINADDFYSREAYLKAIQYFEENIDDTQFCMVGYLLENTLSPNGTVSRGIGTTNDQGYLVTVQECHNITMQEGKIYYNDDQGKHTLSSNSVSMNFWGFYPGILRELGEQFRIFIEENIENSEAEFYIPSVVDELVKSGKFKVMVLKTNANWYGVTYQEDKPLVIEGVKSMIRKNVYPTPLWIKN